MRDEIEGNLLHCIAMFTGIIEATASVLESANGRLILERPTMFDDITLGSSIAVSGVCLSIVEFDDRSMRFDVVNETMRKTKLGDLKMGDVVNVERSMKANGRFEGHIVQGHVEGTAIMKEMNAQHELTIELPADLIPFIIPKGSVTIDGVSLTVARIEGSLCTVALIPHTLAITTLGTLKPDDRINIETDILGRYVLSHSHA